jgi:SAM-dependent methyltransferase
VSVPGKPRSTLSSDYQRDWPAYFDAVASKPPRDTLVRALRSFELECQARQAQQGPGQRLAMAVDLACGEGRDARAILAAQHPRWRVLALDASPEAIARTVRQCPAEDADRFAAAQLALEDVATNPVAAGLARQRSVSLVNASFALPFCRPGAFDRLWAWINAALGPGGRFAGQFFGDRDEWAPIRPASHRTRAQVLALLAGFEVEHLEEVDREGDDAMGGVKHHHVFHVVARRASTSTVA